MGDPLKNLEERLEKLVPQGLSESGRARLEGQIDELASQVELVTGSGGRWQRVAGIAAVLAALAAVVVMVGVGQPEEDATVEVNETVASPREGPAAEEVEDSGIEMVESQREVVEDGRDGGIVLTRINEPMRSWNYNVREVELVLDKESGLEVRIVSEREEAVLTAVTSF